MAKINVEQARERLLLEKEPQSTGTQPVDGVRKIKRAPVANQVEFVKSLGKNGSIFMFKKNGKYVLSPADDELNPILAELDEAPTTDDLPINFEGMMDDYNDEIEYFQENEPEMAFAGDSGIEFVDLGLSVKWAKCNLGATKPEECGNYYAWGEMETKTDYKIATYKYYNAETKKYQSLGEISKTEYDVAYHTNKGFCIPTIKQIDELIKNCTWTKTTLNGVDGWEVKGKNNNTIFFPINGCYSESSKLGYTANAYIWSGDEETKGSSKAKVLKVTDKPIEYVAYKRSGVNIRPVASGEASENDDNSKKLVDLGLSVKWADKNVGAETETDFGDYYAWGELETKDDYTVDTYKHCVPEEIVCKSIGSNIQKTKYDAAYAYDKGLCMPTSTQLKELMTKCTVTSNKVNDVIGFKFTGPNGNSIFIPSSGYKVTQDNNVGKYIYLWSATQSSDTMAQNIRVTTSKAIATTTKRAGMPLRPCASGEVTPTKAIKLVDLGLPSGLKWADMNIGASKVSDYGTYFAWGEVEGNKAKYDWQQYTLCSYKATTYNNIGTDISKKSNYDVAFKLDNSVCLPTEAQMNELITKCTWTKTTKNDVKGWDVKGPSGNSIFIPINGCYSESDKVSYTDYAYYWTATGSGTSSQAIALKTTDKPIENFKLHRRTGAGIRPVSVKGTEILDEDVPMLMPYKWSQTAPCNNKMLKDPTTGKVCYTGCSNTALSQIMAYWGCIGVDGKKYRRGCTATEAYTSSRGDVKIDIPALEPITVFDYDNFKETIALLNKTSASKEAVSTIMQYVGYVSKANYSSSGTGTPCANSLDAIKNHLFMGSNAQLISASSGFDKWVNKVHDNILKKWPVMMFGWNESGSGGHAFVCDGYRSSDDKYHINWGYTGNYNGWYSLSSLIMGEKTNFNHYKRAIVNICPEYVLGDTNDDNKIDITDVTNIINEYLANKYSSKMDVNSDGIVDEKDIKVIIDVILGLSKL